MHKQDHETIARAFRVMLEEHPYSDNDLFTRGVKYAAEEIAASMMENNEDFDRGQFIAACGF